MADIIAKTWNDSSFKTKLKKDPAAVLKAAGISGITDQTILKVVENSSTLKYIVLPPESSGSDYEDDTLKYIKKMLPLPTGLELALVQNTDHLNHIVLPVKPQGHQGTLDASHAQVLASSAYEAVNVATTANVVAEANAAAVQNVAGATEAAAAAVALVVIGVVI